jgi:methyl-accepting chemotaxis protein
MFKSMRLSFKITLGFAVILILALALGTLALWNMKNVAGLSVKLAKDYVPEVAVANNVERYSLDTMYEMRGYGLCQDQHYLEEGRKNLKEVRKYLEDAKQLAAKSVELVKLKEGVIQAEAKVNEYERLVNQTVAKNEDIAGIRKTMDEAASKFMTNAGSYETIQKKELKREIASSETSDHLLERQLKVDLIGEVINLGNSIRISNFKFQALSDSQFVNEAMKYFEEIDKKIEQLKTITVIEQAKKEIAETAIAATSYKQSMIKLLDDWNVLQEVGKKRGATGEQVVQTAKGVALAGMEHTNDIASVAASSLSLGSFIMTVGLSAVFILGIGLAYIIVRSITKPIARVVEGLSESSDQVASASGQVSSASQQLAEGASEQAASIEETSSSLEEMSSMTRQNADNAKQANQLMSGTKETVARASQSMEMLTTSMGEISRASEETSKIIKTIDEIAFQTNLLALNAAVEAARAGEAGAGFAVVADEVRNLALRAAEAAKNTANLIEGTVKKVKEGSELVVKTEQEFREVATSVGRSSELVGEISAASVEQSQGIEQVNMAVGEMDKVVQQNAANAEESASASEEMNGQAIQMKDYVGELKSLVDGSKGNGTVRSSASTGRRTAEKKTAKNPSRDFAGHQNKGNAHIKRPEQVIPFDKGELSEDF